MSVLNDYKGSWLRGDVIAGITVAAIAIPESLGYAKIAGLPIQTGLYCALLPALMFALIGSSRQLVVGADSATAALVAAGAGLVAAQGTAEYASAVGVLCILTAVFLLLFAVAKLEFLADLISQPVLAGFLSGVGVSLIIGQPVRDAGGTGKWQHLGQAHPDPQRARPGQLDHRCPGVRHRDRDAGA